jgi:hypothetical protein
MIALHLCHNETGTLSPLFDVVDVVKSWYSILLYLLFYYLFIILLRTGSGSESWFFLRPDTVLNRQDPQKVTDLVKYVFEDPDQVFDFRTGPRIWPDPHPDER